MVQALWVVIALIALAPELSAASFSVKRELGYRPTNGGSETVSHSP